jgi:hypothetical protein
LINTFYEKGHSFELPIFLHVCLHPVHEAGYQLTFNPKILIAGLQLRLNIMRHSHQLSALLRMPIVIRKVQTKKSYNLLAGHPILVVRI